MAYATFTQIAAYGKFSSDDESLFTDLVSRATAIIEQYTGRVFESTSDDVATRYYNYEDDCDGAYLYLDKELAAISSITVGSDTLQSSDYTTLPVNDTPYYAFRMTDNASLDWTNADSDGNYEKAIAVQGNWAYSTSVSADITHATIRLAIWLYKMRESSTDFDRPFVTGDGVTIMPGRLPHDVMQILSKYKLAVVHG